MKMVVEYNDSHSQFPAVQSESLLGLLQLLQCVTESHKRMCESVLIPFTSFAAIENKLLFIPEILR